MGRKRAQFIGGIAQIIPETAKFNINTMPPEQLYRLLLALGTRADSAREITMAIVDWRTGAGDGRITPFDQFYLSLYPTFRPHHASLEEIEELLLVKGMTPEQIMEARQKGQLAEIMAGRG